MKIFDSLFYIFSISVVIGMIIIGGYIQVQQYKQTEDYCNKKYGFNGWVLNETTGTDNNKYYIGQVWECVPLLNSTTNKNTN